MATPGGSSSSPLTGETVARAEEPTDAAPPAVVAPAPPLATVERLLFEPEGICAFDFFQAIRLLVLMGLKDRVLVGEDGAPHREMVRFLAHRSLAFPASVIQSLTRAPEGKPPHMTVNFMGLTGPNGVLPRHYTERLWTEARGPERTALQDWLDVFNHRSISLFYRAWEKYHFFVPFERGEATQREPDAFSRCLFSLIGLGFRSHRNRFRVVFGHTEPRRFEADAETHAAEETHAEACERTVHTEELARLDDLGLLRFSGLFARRPRCALSLETFLRIYLQCPVMVLQFQGQWLHLNVESQTSMGAINNCLGQDSLVGDRIWDVQSKIRIRLGPLKYEQFLSYLPDRSPLKDRKNIFLLAQLVRFYLGGEIDVEFQLVLKKDEVPGTEAGPRSRLGWNTWSRRKPYPRDADDTVFTVAERPWVNDASRGA